MKMTTLTKAKFGKIVTQIDNAKTIGEKFAIADRAVLDCDANLTDGKYYDELTKIMFRYQRMHYRAQDGEGA
jgi:hypothetical protein